MAPRENIEWDFNRENAQKKSIGRSDRHRVRKHKGCKLPSDSLTPAQKRKLNGEVITMNLNKPVRYGEFKFWPKDIQEKYLNSLHERFGATRKDICLMFGITPKTLANLISNNGLKIFPASKGNRLQDPEGWENFKKGLLSVSETPEEAPKPKEPEKPIDIPKMQPPAKQPRPIGFAPLMPDEPYEKKNFKHFATEFEGLESINDVVAIIRNLPWKGDVKVRIEVISN